MLYWSWLMYDCSWSEEVKLWFNFDFARHDFATCNFDLSRFIFLSYFILGQLYDWVDCCVEGGLWTFWLTQGVCLTCWFRGEWFRLTLCCLALPYFGKLNGVLWNFLVEILDFLNFVTMCFTWCDCR